MKYFFYFFLLFIAFNLFAADRIPAENSGGYTFNCTYNGNVAQIKDTEFSICEDVIKTGILEDTTFPSISTGFTPWSPDSAASCSYQDLLGNSSYYIITCSQDFISEPSLSDDTRSPEFFQSSKVGSLDNKQPDSNSYTCPNPDYPEGPLEEDFEFWCYALELEPDPDCPAPTDSDPYIFGTGSQQTTVCYSVPNGRQCAIQTDSTGGYRLPVSFGSAEPVQCIPDPDPEPDPEPTPDPDPTPNPEPTPDPDPTNPTPEQNELDALNKINENLDVINKNQSVYSDSNSQRLDRIAKEIQNSNEYLSSIKSKPSGSDLTVTNEILSEIAQNTSTQQYNDECIGDLCEFDIQTQIDEKNSQITDWIEQEEPTPQPLDDYTSNLTNYVSQNFAGFTGTCQPFVLDVSIAGKTKTINVHQHCDPYENYFKPLVEWLLWTFTAIALINISSQSFRAFSSL